MVLRKRKVRVLRVLLHVTLIQQSVMLVLHHVRYHMMPLRIVNKLISS